MTLQELLKEQEQIEERINSIALEESKPFLTKRDEEVLTIPRFWSNVFYQCESIQEFIIPEDWLLIKCINKVNVTRSSQNPYDFVFECEFSPEVRFCNQKLTKSFIWNKPKDRSDTGYFSSNDELEINWSEVPGENEKSILRWFEYTTTDSQETREKFTKFAQILCDEIYGNALDLYVQATDPEAFVEEFDINNVDN